MLQPFPANRLALLAGLLVVAARATVAAEPDVDRIRRDFQARYKSTADFVYRLRGEFISPPGTLITPGDEAAPPSVKGIGYPLRELRQPTDRSWSVDLRNGRLRKDHVQLTFHVDKLAHARRRLIKAFDGVRLWTGRPETLRFKVQSREGVDWLFSSSDMPVFLAHGLFPLQGEGGPDVLPETIEQFDLIPVRTEVIDGRPCEVVEIRRKDAEKNHTYEPLLYIDPQRQSAIVRVERFFNGVFLAPGPTASLAKRITISYREQDGRWLPDRWVDQSFFATTKPSGQLHLSERYEYVVEDAIINGGIDAARFLPAIEVALPPDALPREPVEAPTP